MRRAETRAELEYRRINLAGNRSVNADWMSRARCVSHPELEFVTESPANLAELREVCFRCPVKRECLEYAFEQPCSIAYGVYVGTTGSQRKRAAAYVDKRRNR